MTNFRRIILVTQEIVRKQKKSCTCIQEIIVRGQSCQSSHKNFGLRNDLLPATEFLICCAKDSGQGRCTKKSADKEGGEKSVPCNTGRRRRK
ncbi:hypothetical protein QR680_003776 [Steinernema hermaphroditum]|uniref:Uncharacterized protein n=1 Tax=Steinernema hermaphroditum TaxID=289476 RepID=A0AA39HMJ0_9BILA|nr:hypothetical protein QR680_003776 [Steinernema hermaphroditum]